MLTQRQKIGAAMQQWHSSMGDPIYAVGSYYYAGHKYPDANVTVAALESIESYIPRAERGEHGWTKRDARQLRSIAAFIKKDLKGTMIVGRGRRGGENVLGSEGRAGGTATYRKGYSALFPQKVREALSKEYHGRRPNGEEWHSYGTAPDYGGKLARIVGRRITGDRIPKDLEGTWTAPNGVRVHIERATGAYAQHRLFVWCTSCREWVPYGRVAQHSGGNKHQSAMRRPGGASGSKKPGRAGGRTPYRVSYSEWLGSVDDTLVKAGVRTGIDNVSKTWLRVHYADGTRPAEVARLVKSGGYAKGRSKKAGRSGGKVGCGCSK